MNEMQFYSNFRYLNNMLGNHYYLRTYSVEEINYKNSLHFMEGILNAETMPRAFVTVISFLILTKIL